MTIKSLSEDLRTLTFFIDPNYVFRTPCKKYFRSSLRVASPHEHKIKRLNHHLFEHSTRNKFRLTFLVLKYKTRIKYLPCKVNSLYQLCLHHLFQPSFLPSHLVYSDCRLSQRLFDYCVLGLVKTREQE